MNRRTLSICGMIVFGCVLSRHAELHGAQLTGPVILKVNSHLGLDQLADIRLVTSGNAYLGIGQQLRVVDDLLLDGGADVLISRGLDVGGGATLVSQNGQIAVDVLARSGGDFAIEADGLIRFSANLVSDGNVDISTSGEIVLDEGVLISSAFGSGRIDGPILLLPPDDGGTIVVPDRSDGGMGTGGTITIRSVPLIGVDTSTDQLPGGDGSTAGDGSGLFVEFVSFDFPTFSTQPSEDVVFVTDGAVNKVLDRVGSRDTGANAVGGHVFLTNPPGIAASDAPDGVVGDDAAMGFSAAPGPDAGSVWPHPDATRITLTDQELIEVNGDVLLLIDRPVAGLTVESAGQIIAVPEPWSVSLFGLGAAVIACGRRRVTIHWPAQNAH